MPTGKPPAASFTMPPGIAGTRARAVIPVANDAALNAGFGRFIGTSPAMCALYQKIETSAPRDVPIFLTGESGTGKGTCAEALHKHGAKPSGPYIAFNCQSASSHSLFNDDTGAFARAHGGTLFLDDIAELEPASQGELLIFILDGHVEKSTVRLICATSRPVTHAIDAGLLREDLYNYLHVLGITVPPLRARDRDVLDIAHLLLCQAGARSGKAFHDIDEDAAALLLQHSWPGNLRQLRNIVEQLIPRLNGHAVVTAEILRPLLPRPASAEKSSAAHAALPLHPAETILFGNGSQIQTYAVVERALIERAIALCAGNVPRAAHKLGLSPSTIYRKKAVWDAADSAPA